MPTTFNKSCDVKQGYDYQKGVQTPIGYLTSLKIGDLEINADQTVKDPMNPDTDFPVVAVLSGVNWALGVTDPFCFFGQLSVYNKQNVLSLIYKSLTKVDVTFKMAVYEYDPIQNTYFKCLLGTEDAALNGLIDKNSAGELSLFIQEDASTEVYSPQNYAFRIDISPQPSAQTVTVATAFSAKDVNSWGRKVG